MGRYCDDKIMGANFYMRFAQPTQSAHNNPHRF